MKKVQMLIVSVIVLVLCPLSWALDTTGLVAYWNLNEGSGDTAHDSAGNNDGAIHGAAWTGGISGTALLPSQSRDNQEKYFRELLKRRHI